MPTYSTQAFTSRIHIKLFFNKLDPKSRLEIWNNHFESLEERRKDIDFKRSKLDDLLESKAMTKLDWNGRQIRNAFQTAVALAEYEAQASGKSTIILEPKHIKEVAEVANNFEEYLYNLKGRTASQIAFQNGTRNQE